MGRYYKVAMGFLTLGFEMNLLLMTLGITNFPDAEEALFICAFIAYSFSFLMAGFLNFGYLKDNRLLPFAAAGPAILAAVFIGAGLSLLSSRVVRSVSFFMTVYGVSLVFAGLSAGLMIFGRFRHG